jgi:hypothetical protein
VRNLEKRGAKPTTLVLSSAEPGPFGLIICKVKELGTKLAKIARV